uniref:Glycosyltransferases n=1 Tax=Oryza glumipatula TaxID=40148 RepID=A0A0E0AM29_9ORYZ
MKFFAAPAGRAGLGAVVLVAASRCPLFSFFALLVLLLFQPHHQLAASHVAVNQQVSLVPDAAAAKAAGVGNGAVVDVGDEEEGSGSRWMLIVVTTTRSGGRERRRRNAALAHVEKHYFPGVVHFADAAGVYDAHFFDKIRQTEIAKLKYRLDGDVTAGEEVDAGLPAPLACLPHPSMAVRLRACGFCNGGREQWRRRVASRQPPSSCRPSPAADALVLSLLSPPKAATHRRPPQLPTQTGGE